MDLNFHAFTNSHCIPIIKFLNHRLWFVIFPWSTAATPQILIVNSKIFNGIENDALSPSSGSSYQSAIPRTPPTTAPHVTELGDSGNFIDHGAARWNNIGGFESKWSYFLLFWLPSDPKSICLGTAYLHGNEPLHSMVRGLFDQTFTKPL